MYVSDLSDVQAAGIKFRSALHNVKVFFGKRRNKTVTPSNQVTWTWPWESNEDMIM